VLFVNGIPLVVIEAKSPKHATIEQGYAQLHDYQEKAPKLFVPNQFMVTTDGDTLKYGTIGAPWEHFREWKDGFPHEFPEYQFFLRGLYGLFDRHNFLDIVQNFTTFVTDNNHKFKIICRYQQFRAVRKLTSRVLEGKYDRGLIWHTQGSGKSYTMVFAARKLRHLRELENPLVFIVVDRKSLDSQMTETFINSDAIPAKRITDASALRECITSESQRVYVTTVHKFAFPSSFQVEPLPESSELLINGKRKPPPLPVENLAEDTPKPIVLAEGTPTYHLPTHDVEEAEEADKESEDEPEWLSFGPGIKGASYVNYEIKKGPRKGQQIIKITLVSSLSETGMRQLLADQHLNAQYERELWAAYKESHPSTHIGQFDIALPPEQTLVLLAPSRGTTGLFYTPRPDGSGGRVTLLSSLAEETYQALLNDPHLASYEAALRVAYQQSHPTRHRQRVIVLADEAHRSQEGDLARDGMFETLSHASFFGFTGTPIAKDDLNTHKNFGIKLEDGQYERYLDLYHIRQAIDDGATVPVHYEARLAKWNINGDALDAAFLKEFGEVDEAIREQVKRQTSRLKVLLLLPERIKAIAKDVGTHYQKHLAPLHFKAQVVLYNREACALFKQALDETKLLETNESAIIFTESQHDDSLLKKYHLGEAQKPTIELFKQPKSSIKLLIVCDMLLTGFDAPVEQVMYLDKPLKDHTLLQAIARTNRPYPGKTNGLVIDYYGVFTKLEEALNFDESEVEQAAVPLDELRAKFKPALEQALDFFEGIPLSPAPQHLAEARQRTLVTDQAEIDFTERFKKVQSLYETLAPDDALKPYQDDYRWLCTIYALYRKAKTGGATGEHPLLPKYRKKTEDLIRQYTQFEDELELFPVLKLDKDYLQELAGQAQTPEQRISQMRVDLRRELTPLQDDTPEFKKLSQRLEELIEEFRRGIIDSLTLLDGLEKVTEEFISLRGELNDSGLSPGEMAMYQLVKQHIQVVDEQLIHSFVRDLVDQLEDLLFPNWKHLDEQKRKVHEMLIFMCIEDYEELDLYPGEFVEQAMSYIIRHFDGS
jgi:type I site-specific restriction-modification system R (restriction) subunit